MDVRKFDNDRRRPGYVGRKKMENAMTVCERGVIECESSHQNFRVRVVYVRLYSSIGGQRIL